MLCMYVCVCTYTCMYVYTHLRKCIYFVYFQKIENTKRTYFFLLFLKDLKRPVKKILSL